MFPNIVLSSNLQVTDYVHVKHGTSDYDRLMKFSCNLVFRIKCGFDKTHLLQSPTTFPYLVIITHQSHVSQHKFLSTSINLRIKIHTPIQLNISLKFQYNIVLSLLQVFYSLFSE